MWSPPTCFVPPQTAGAGDQTATLHWLTREFLPKVHRRRFARYADLAWDDSPEMQPVFVEYLETARKLGFRSKIHAEKVLLVGSD